MALATMHGPAVLKEETVQRDFPDRALQNIESPAGSKLCGGETMATPTRYLDLPVTRCSMHRSSEAGAVHPALPAVVLLISFAVFMAAIAPLDFTSIVRRLFPSPSQTVPHQNAAVWIDNSAGVYYCADSIMFGKSRGEYMKQVDALDRGYQPALGTYCNGPDWQLPSQQIPTPAASTPAPTPTMSAAPGLNPFENPKSQSGVSRTALPSSAVAPH